jgi:hypothetical protein
MCLCGLGVSWDLLLFHSLTGQDWSRAIELSFHESHNYRKVEFYLNCCNVYTLPTHIFTSISTK